MTITLPMRIVSRANQREHWAKRAKRERMQAATLWLHMQSLRHVGELSNQSPPDVVTFVRIAPRMLDSDNLAISFKKWRDTVARFYGVDDSPRGPITWRYDQRKGEPKQYAVEVQLEGVPCDR